jgi:hypothetical protein
MCNSLFKNAVIITNLPNVDLLMKHTKYMKEKIFTLSLIRTSVMDKQMDHQSQLYFQIILFFTVQILLNVSAFLQNRHQAQA